ncbi:MAG TPA: amidohydrolase family protein, partial [bacterium]|nr:amidohydrolase family protein [bacterium]
RFAAFAGLPTQDPQAAADELERAVVKLGCKGALVNGHTQGHYLDERPWWVLWERAEALDVPIYIHPADAPRPILDTYFKDYPELAGAAWGWGIDMGTHVLRLMCSGLFDAHPKAKVIVGHMGELIPFHIRRINRGLSGARTKAGAVMKRTVYEYMHDNVFMTTSGVFDPAALTCAIAAVGADNILFSVDDPFEDNAAGVAFLQSAPVDPTDREKLAHGNAERLLRV